MTDPKPEPESEAALDPRQETEAALSHGDAHPARVAQRRAREHAIERLSDAFARDELTLEAFEQRVDQAFACRVPEDFAALVHDLSAAGAPTARHALVRLDPALPATSAPPAERVALSVLGNVERRGRFTLPRRGRALSVLGNVELDLRDVTFPPGVTELRVNAVLGNIEITVPPTLAVETAGSSILGSFESMCRVPAEREDEPVLRIVGNAVLGNVEIQTRPRALPPRKR